MKKWKSFTATLLLLTGFLLPAILLAIRISKYELGKAEYRYLQNQFSPRIGWIQNNMDQIAIEKQEEKKEGWSGRMAARNPDYAFWIWIPGTKISYPVVKNTVPGYYLNHTFCGEANPCGSIFLQEEGTPPLDNLVVHGHNMKDGSMFADLKRYMAMAYRKDHPDIWIYWQADWLHYIIYACQVASEEELYGSSLYQEKPRLEMKEAILTLSTCFGKGKRLMIQAVFSPSH